MHFERLESALWQTTSLLLVADSQAVAIDPCISADGVGPRNAQTGATRREREPPSDAEIERGLRERAITSARDAEVLLRWRQTVRPPDAPPGVDLDSMSERELERLYSGLVRLASLDETVLAALVEHVLAEEEPDSSR